MGEKQQHKKQPHKKQKQKQKTPKHTQNKQNIHNKANNTQNGRNLYFHFILIT